MEGIRLSFSGRAKQLLRRGRESLSRLRTRWDAGRYCPICEQASDHFLSFGVNARKDAKCPRCGSLERHRFLWLFLTQKTDLFDGQPKTMLHVAPEPSLEGKFRQQLGSRYITADLLDPRATLKMDVTDIQCDDESFDVIYCSHVLEHVPDDRKAMREFYRVLKKSGWAILLVPITADKTFEDPSIVDPVERLKHFGQSDHVRRYGPDYVDRLREAGFRVDLIRVSDLATRSDVKRMGLTRSSGEIFYCTRVEPVAQ